MQYEEYYDEKGQPTPIHLKAGPTQDRSCTDILCCIMFLGMQIAIAAIAIYAFSNGDPSKLATPYDPDHRPCGVGAQADYPYIYFVNPNPSYLYRTTCVSQCPDNTATELKCLKNTRVPDCKALSSTDNDKIILIYDTIPFGGRICVPKSADLYNKIKNTISGDKVENAIHDLKNTWMIISCSALIAIVVSFLFLCVLRMCAGVVVWTFILIIVVGFILMGAFFYLKYSKLKDTPTPQDTDAKSEQETSNIKSNLEKKMQNPELCLYASIIFFSIGGIFFISICCLCSRIKLAIAVIKCASRFITETPSVLLVSPLCFLLMCLCFVYWFATITYLFGCGEVTTKDKALPFAQFSYSDDIKKLSWANLFGFLWNSVFLMDAADFIIMGSVAYWYFQRRVQQNHTCKSLGIFLKYHLGTVAFGSLLTAIILFLRIVLEYADKQSKAQQKQAGRLARMIFSCLKCCLWCFQKCIQFISKKAYIQTIMTSKSFCPAAKDGLLLVLRNPIRIAITSGIGSIFQFLGTLCITVLTTLICYLIITNWSYYTDILISPIYPTICFAILSFCVASFFMSIYGTSADTIIVLFCMDEEMHKNQPSQNTPPELVDIINSK